MLLAGGVAVRAEPLTTTANIFVVLGLLAMLVHAFGSDRWLTYGLRDWALAAPRLCGHEATGTPRLVMAAHRASVGTTEQARGVALPVVRGLLLAAPVVVVLAALLASADAVFASRLTDLSQALPQPEEAFGRLLLALVVAYAAAGGLWHLSQRSDRRVLGGQPVPRLLGFPEAATVLVSVNVLLAGFVAIQLRYFFGGQEALLAEGLTYAEYARRGFGELLFVAAISLALHLALAGLTRRETSTQRWAFTVLTAGRGAARGVPGGAVLGRGARACGVPCQRWTCHWRARSPACSVACGKAIRRTTGAPSSWPTPAPDPRSTSCRRVTACPARRRRCRRRGSREAGLGRQYQSSAVDLDGLVLRRPLTSG